MSTRQTQINKFTDGINTDLHPLTAPDNLLSDCVNGTVITYNGNEYILQNDMGNYQLKNANLPVNHIPIGVKEYGGIIYIVSHNPVDNITEVGCYPSPKTLSESDQSEVSGEDYGLITLPSLFTNYSTLVGQTSLKLYSTEEDFKLYPGDKYYIHYDQDNNKEYQTLEFYVIGEDKTSYKLEDKDIEYSKTKYDGDPKSLNSVKWETPGWLAYKYRIATLDAFNLQLTNVSVPPFITGTDPVPINFSLKGQVHTSDVLYNNPVLRNKLHIWVTTGIFDSKGNKHYSYVQQNSLAEALESDGEGMVNGGTETDPIEDFPVLTVIKKNYKGEDVLVQGNLLSISSISYTGLNRFLYTKKVPSSKLSCLKLQTTDNKTQFFIEAMPIIVNADKSGGEKQHILYDNFEQTTTINLETLSTAESLEALSYFKYTVDDDEVTINFDIISSSSIMDGVTTTINIYAPQKEENSDNIEIGKAIKTITLSNVSYVGQNIVTIPFTNKFEKEGAYIFELSIKWGNETEAESKTWYRTLMASEVMNLFYNSYEDFSLIPLSEIVKKIDTFIKAQKPEFVFMDSKQSLYTNPAEEDKYKFNILEPNKYPVSTSYGSIVKEQNWPACGIKCTDSYKLNLEERELFENEGIWKNALDNETISFGDNNSIELSDDEGTVGINYYSYGQIPITVQNEQIFSYKRIYMCDYTWLFDSISRPRKAIDYNKNSKTWYKVKYWVAPNGKRGADNVFIPTAQMEQYLGCDPIKIDKWNEFVNNAAEAIKGEPADKGQFDLIQRSNNVVSSQSGTYTADWNISATLNECMQVVNIELPWSDKVKHVYSEEFVDGPFITTYDYVVSGASLPDYHGGPSLYAGWSWLYLDGVGEYTWRSDDKRIPDSENRNVFIWEKGTITEYYPYSYYWDKNENYNVWSKRYEEKGDPKNAPSPDPLLIQPYGYGTDNAANTNNPAGWTKIRPLKVGMGEFLPMYSGQAHYSDANDEKPTFPSISGGNSPTWIRSIWGIRMPVKINGQNRWAILPLKESIVDPSVSLWINNSEGYLSALDTDIMPTKNTPVSRHDLSDSELAEWREEMHKYNLGTHTFDQVKIRGWNNDGQSCAYINEIMSRAATLATHLYTVEEESQASPVGILKPTDITQTESNTVTIDNISFNYEITSDNVRPWGYRNNALLLKNGVQLDINSLSNVEEFFSTTVTKTIKLDKQYNSNNKDWIISLEGKDYTYSGLMDKLRDASNVLLDNYSSFIADGTIEKHPQVVYHDLTECSGEDKDKLLPYFDYLVDNKAFVFSNDTFRINPAGLNDVGMTLDINAEATWMFGKAILKSSYSKAYDNSRLTLGALCPKIGLPPKPMDLSLSPHFIQTND